MQRSAGVTTFVAAIVFLSASSLLAQGRGGGGARGGASGGPGLGGGPSGSYGRPDLDRGSMDRGGREPGMHREQHEAMTSHKTPGELLTQNTQLSERLATLLPAGTNVQDAAAGFKNLGQFVAAVHVSKNLGIPFEDLKTRVTGPEAVKLGKAIKELKPEVDATAEAKKAEKQAKQDLKLGASAP